MSLAKGDRVGPYRVISPLGAGGMGEVYRARDAALGRDVALKILPHTFTADPDRVARFEREARVLGALNHPHIGAIYGIAEQGGIRALVLELIEGDSLAARIARGRAPARLPRKTDEPARGLALQEALRIAEQIADALDAAHEKGIVHRDLKPANVMITPVGVVKVLDFGLAKATTRDERDPASVLSQSATALAAMTEPGMVLGTPAYMSPEQARGLDVDRRTDIWAFGCVLYEMLTGRRPFRGATFTDTLVAIFEREPDWEALPEAVPTALRRLIRRCLEKDPRQRLRDIADVRFALEDSTSESGDATAAPVLSAAARQRTARSIPIALAVLTAMFGIGWWVNRLAVPVPLVAEPVADMTLAPLTTDPGYDGEPTFSPDGETVAYVSDRTGNFDIFLRQASGGRDINLTSDAADDVQPAFSPDGTQIAFVSSRAGGSAIQFMGTDYPLLGGDIWVMPALGGNARRVAVKGNFPSWSADGKLILYTAGPWFGKKIYKVSAAGGASQEIPVALEPTQHWMFPSYSPDSRWIVFEAAPADIYVVSAQGGTPHRVARGNHPIWNAAGDAIFYSSQEPGRNHSLWQVPIAITDAAVAGPSQPLTIGRGRDLPGAVSRDGKRVAFTVQEDSFNLEVMPFDGEAGRELGPAELLTIGNQLIFFHSFSPDGRALAFDSRRGADSRIWRLDRGGVPQELTSDSSFEDSFPRWSPDGQTIVFNRRSITNLQANTDLWMMAADGGNPREVVRGAGAATAWLPGSARLVYHKSGQLELLDLMSGQSRRLTDEPRVMPIMVVSPDGRWVIYQSTASGNVDLRAVPVEGGASRVVVATPFEDYHPSLSPSGRWLYFQPDHKNLSRVPGPAQDWREAAPQQVTYFPESGLRIEDIQPSPDGRQLAFARGRTTGDVWILNVRK